jgi:predicted metal-dependent hydrolase
MQIRTPSDFPPRGIVKAAAACFTFSVQFDFLFRSPPTPRTSAADTLLVGARAVPLRLVPNARARRYVLRLQPDGTARVTIPLGGTQKFAREFARQQTAWLEAQFRRREENPPVRDWTYGTEIYYRGTTTPLILDPTVGTVRFADQMVPLPEGGAVRVTVERHLRQLAAGELPPRTLALAAAHGLTVRRVTVRNQRSRWGSCSRAGTVSLNWRLIQAPEPVRDYIILHELMHLREMNHSQRFWRHVAAVCPDFVVAERWLKQHGKLLR